MNDPVVISPKSNLIRHVAGLLLHDGRDYSRNLVVFPGKRPAHFLRNELSSRTDGPFIPPVIVPVDELVASIATPHRPPGYRLLEVPDAVSILYDLHCKEERRIGGREFLDLERFFPLGEKIFSELEELKIADVPAVKLRELSGSFSLADLNVLAVLYEQFYALCAEKGYSTRSSDYVLASAKWSEDVFDGYDRVVIAGLYALTPSEEVLFRGIGQLDKTRMVFVKGPRLAVHLAHLGLPSEEAVSEPDHIDATYVSAPDLHGQVASLAAKLRSEIDGGSTPDQQSVLVLPRADALFPVVQHLLPLFPNEGYNVSMEYPVSRTPLYGLFGSIVRAIERAQDNAYFVPDYLNVLSHPYVKNLSPSGTPDITRVTVQGIEEYLARRPGRMYRRLEEVEDDDELMRLLDRRSSLMPGREIDSKSLIHEVHDNVFRAWGRAVTLGDFASSLGRLVRYVSDHTEAMRHPYFRDFAESMLESARLIRDSLLADKTTPSPAASLRLIGYMLDSSRVPFPGSPLQGFQVLGLLETRGLAFENVYLIDANDDALPETGSAAPLLPQIVRQKLHLRTRKDREDIIEYYLTVLLASAGKVWISWNDAVGSQRSRFVEELIWRDQRAKRVLPLTEPVSSVQYRVDLHVHRPAPREKTKAEDILLERESLSATALDTYLRCQLRFYFTYVLGLSSRDEVTGEIEASEVGKAVHVILERFFTSRKGQPLSADNIPVAEIASLADSVCDEVIGTTRTASFLLLRENVRKRMEEFILGYQVRIADGRTITIQDLEQGYDGVIGGARIRARIDRVESRKSSAGETTTHILDYKTSGDAQKTRIRFDRIDVSNRTTWRDAIGSLQLYVYATLYAQQHGVPRESLEPAYVYLGAAVMDENAEIGLFDGVEMDRKAGFQVLDTVVDSLVKEIRYTSELFHPTNHPEKECPECPFTALCGTGWTRLRDYG